jgi:TolB-like protein/DNA-binding winged helix-turn-helix (wHTH) protein/Tfp pilus assembly protein PilF
MMSEFRLAEWLVQPELNTIVKAGEALRLEPKVMALLLCLSERAGEVVLKESLIQRVWSDRFVSDEVLTTTVFELRKALGDEAKNPRFVQTVPRKGYRLIASIATVVVGEPEIHQPINIPKSTPPHSLHAVRASLPARWLSVGAVLTLTLTALSGWLGPWRRGAEAEVTPIRSIAVLPLDTLIKDAEHEALACAFTEALRTQLAKLQTMRVVARTSVVPYKLAGKPTAEIARELGVDALVEGAVLRSGQRIRITAQFIHAASDQHLWAESYERAAGDLLGLQDEVAQAITREIRTSLTLRELAAKETTLHPINTAAREAYLRGRQYWQQQTETGVRQALEQFECALEMTPGFAQAYSGLADAYLQLVNLNALRPEDGFPKAKVAALRALQLDPQAPEAHTSLAKYKFMHDWDWAGAEAEFKRALALRPDYTLAHQWYGEYLSAAGRPEEAQRELAEAQRQTPTSPQSTKPVQAEIAQTRQHGNPTQLLKNLGAVLRQKYIRPTDVARLYLDNGDKEQALAWLENAYVERDSQLLLLKADRRWVALQTDPRFATLAQRVGLPACVAYSMK